MYKTPLTRVLLGRCRKPVGLLVLTVFLILGFLTVVKPQIATAAAPSNLNFQARLMTSGGGIVADGNYNVEFKLYNTATVTGTPDQGACTRNGGTAEPACLWVETRTSGNVVTVKNGYLTVNLGSVTAFGGGVDWSQQMWLSMRIGGIGTPSWDAEMSPRLQLTATPFAMYAANTALLGGLSSSQFIQNTTSPQSSSNFNITGNGTIGGNLSVTGTYNTNTFNANTLTFGGASAATIQSASGQDLTVDSGGAGALNLGTGATAKIITIGNGTGNTSVVINSGTNGISIGNNAVNKTINIGVTGSTANTTAVNVGTSTGAAQTIKLGGTGLSGGSHASTTVGLQGGATALSVANSGTTIQTFTNSASAFQVQNSNATPIFGVDTTSTAANLVTNPGFEANATGWANKGTGAITRITTPATALYYGIGAGQLVTGTAANNGTSYAVTLTLGATYNLSFYARASTGTATGINFGYTNTGGDQNCSTGNSIPSTGFTRFTCSFTVTTTAGTAFYVKQTGTSTQTIYLDGFQLLSGASSATPYSLGSIQLRGVVNTPVAFQSSNDSTTAFQIQNSAGTSNLFVADTINGFVGIGTASPIVKLDVVGVNGVDVKARLYQPNGFYAAQVLQSNNAEFQLGVGGSAVGATNSGNFFIYNPNTNANTLSINGTTNNVGISTTSAAAYKLDVAGDINTSGVYRVGTTSGATTSCSAGQYLQSQVVAGGITTGGTCTTVSGGGGVSSVGAISGTSNANGATITGSVLNLTPADATNGGVVTNTTQTFAGDKTFNGTFTSNSTVTQTYTTTSGTAHTINVNNASGTVTNGMLINAGGAGAVTNALNITGTYTNLINSTNFSVTNSGIITTATLGGSTGAVALCRNASNQISSCGINSAGVTLQNAYDASTNPELVLNGTNGALTIRDNSTPIGANLLEVQNNAGSTTYFGVTTAGIATTAISASSTIAGVGVNSGSGLLQGTGGLTLTGTTSINNNTNSTTSINTGSSNTLVSIGGGSGTFALNTTNIDITSAGAITGATGLTLASGNIDMSASAGTFTSGTGAVALNGSTIGLGDATSDRLTVTAQLLGGSPLVFQGATDNSFTTTLALVDPTANNTITLPNASGTVAVSASGPLSLNATTGALSLGTVGIANGGTGITSMASNSVLTVNNSGVVTPVTGTGTQCLKGGTNPAFGTCGTASTLQDAYDASPTVGSGNPAIQLGATNGGLRVRDAASTVGNLLSLQNSAGTVTYFNVTATGMSLQNSTGSNFAFEMGTNPHLKIFDPTSSSTKYADIYFDAAANAGAGEAVFASVGTGSTTRVGSGTGNIAMQLTNSADVLTFNKTATLAGSYSANDFTITRNLTSGANSETGNVLKVESTGSASGTVSPTLLLVNQANSSATGNLIAAQKGGSNVFTVGSAGTVTVAAGQAYTGLGAVSLTSGSATNLTLSAGTTGAVIVKAATNSTNSFQIQDSSSAVIFSADSTNGNIQIGSSTTDAVDNLLILDSYNQSTDPTGSNGAMYYNTSLAKFRCQENGAWKNCLSGTQDNVSSVLGAAAATVAKAAAGTILVSPVYISGQTTVNEMRVNVTTLLGATGDIGVYNSSGTLVLNGGSGTISTPVGMKTVAPVQTGTSRILEPGQYYVAVTWNSTTGVVAGGNMTTAGQIKRSGTILGGGSVLPSSITPSSITAGQYIYAISLNP